jgi:hypothetical protein
LSTNPNIRRECLESAIRAATDRDRDACSRLERAEELLSAEYERLDPILDRDPRVLAAQSRLTKVEAEFKRRRGSDDPLGVEAGIAKLVVRYPAFHEAQQSERCGLANLSEPALSAEARGAYRALASIRQEIAGPFVADLANAVNELSAAVARERDQLNALKRDAERLRAEEQRKAAEAGDGLPIGRHTPAAAVRPQSIEEFVKARGITRLVHFTRLENLPSILRHGLIPRAELEANHLMAATSKFNDDIRLDQRRDWSCLSISRINYKMYYKYSRDAEWCIILFDPSLLWKQEALFCETNAASTGAVDCAERFGWSCEGLAELFKDPVETPRLGRVSRAGLMPGGLPRHETSNPQAEVLVHGNVSTAFIREVAFRRIEDLERTTEHFAGKRIHGFFDKSRFDARQDYSYWKRANG